MLLLTSLTGPPQPWPLGLSWEENQILKLKILLQLAPVSPESPPCSSWLVNYPSTAMWGISPQTNLLADVNFNSEPSADEAVNILLICPSDPRSVIATIAEESTKRSDSPTELRFYIVEERLEILARHFLLLQIFFDESVPIRQRAVMYLEVFGNSLIQERTASYLVEKAKGLVDFVLDGKEQACTDGMFDLSLLKHKELDGLADIFASWHKSKDSKLQETRDEVLRNFYADRYDW